MGSAIRGAYTNPATEVKEWVDVQATADGQLTVVPGNILTKFREAFEEYSPGTRWVESKASGDIIYVDGNALASSYLVISKDPLTADTVSYVETVARFEAPIEVSVGLGVSQRVVGQEFSVELVDDSSVAVPDELQISSISQAASVLTVQTSVAHNLVPGKRIGIAGVPDSRLNYTALTVATIVSPLVFTCTAGPAGTIPSLTIAAQTTGTVYQRSALGYAGNGTSQVFETASVTKASFFVRSEAGDVLPSGTAAGDHSVTISTIQSSQLVNAPYTYAFQPTAQISLTYMADRLQWADSPVDSLSASSARTTRSQVVPDISAQYKLRFRAVNTKSAAIPTAQIISVSKAGSTTATVEFDRPHGLTTLDQIVAYGVRDQTAFPNLTAATAIASVVDATRITVVWGTSSTSTSVGGYVARINGGNLMSAAGQGAVVVQSASVVNGILTLVGNTNWAGVVNGDLVNAVGIRALAGGASLGVDGAYRARSVIGPNLELEPIESVLAVPELVSTNCGGTIIKRSDIRISFVRIFDFTRQRVELMSRPSTDQAGSQSVVVTNTPGVIATGGIPENSSASTNNPVLVGGVARTAIAPSGLVDGDVVRATLTSSAALVVKPYSVNAVEFGINAAVTATTDTLLVAAAGAGIKNVLTSLWAINTGASLVELIIKDGTVERARYPLPPNVPVPVTYPTAFVTTAAAAINAALSAAGTVRVTGTGYQSY